MNEHTQISDLLPLYVSGALDRDQRLAVEKHLPACAECQADLALWKVLSGEIAAARPGRDCAARAGGAGSGARAPAAPGAAGADSRCTAMQASLARVAAALADAAGAARNLAGFGPGDWAGLHRRADRCQVRVIYALAPLIAATCVSLIYGPDNDPAYELALSTPTSPRQILLARLVLVFGYNLALVLVATLGLLPMLTAQTSQPLLGTLLLTWLAPMTFLSAAALVLSLWIGATNAISITYVAWLAQLLAGPLRSPQAALQSGCQSHRQSAQ